MPKVPPARIIQGLPTLEWRGLYAPCDSAPVDFSHRQAERKYYGVDGAGHDNTGMDPMFPNLRLYFINGVEGDNEAFPHNWNAWRVALFDGSAGDFVHPVLGKFRARVLKGTIQFVSQTTAGVVVDVAFTSTIDSIDKPNKFIDAKPDVQTTAKAAAAAAASQEIRWQPSTLGSTLEGAVSGLFSAVFDAQVTLSGYTNQVGGGILDMIARAESLTDPASYPAYDNLVRLWSEVELLSAAAVREVGRSVGKRITQNDTTLDAFATSVNNDIDEVMALNPGLLRSPSVPKGSTVSFYTGK